MASLKTNLNTATDILSSIQDVLLKKNVVGGCDSPTTFPEVIDALGNEGCTCDLEGYYKKDEVDNLLKKVSAQFVTLNALIENLKSSIGNNNLNLDDYYTKKEVNDLLDKGVTPPVVEKPILKVTPATSYMSSVGGIINVTIVSTKPGVITCDRPEISISPSSFVSTNGSIISIKFPENVDTVKKTYRFTVTSGELVEYFSLEQYAKVVTPVNPDPETPNTGNDDVEPYLILTTTSGIIASDGKATKTFTFNTNDLPVVVTTNNSWISAYINTDNASVTCTASEYEGTSNRTGTVTLTSKRGLTTNISITQTAASVAPPTDDPTDTSLRFKLITDEAYIEGNSLQKPYIIPWGEQFITEIEGNAGGEWSQYKIGKSALSDITTIVGPYLFIMNNDESFDKTMTTSVPICNASGKILSYFNVKVLSKKDSQYPDKGKLTINGTKSVIIPIKQLGLDPITNELTNLPLLGTEKLGIFDLFLTTNADITSRSIERTDAFYNFGERKELKKIFWALSTGTDAWNDSEYTYKNIHLHANTVRGTEYNMYDVLVYEYWHTNNPKNKCYINLVVFPTNSKKSTPFVNSELNKNINLSDIKFNNYFSSTPVNAEIGSSKYNNMLASTKNLSIVSDKNWKANTFAIGGNWFSVNKTTGETNDSMLITYDHKTACTHAGGVYFNYVDDHKNVFRNAIVCPMYTKVCNQVRGLVEADAAGGTVAGEMLVYTNDSTANIEYTGTDKDWYTISDFNSSFDSLNNAFKCRFNATFTANSTFDTRSDFFKVSLLPKYKKSQLQETYINGQDLNQSNWSTRTIATVPVEKEAFIPGLEVKQIGTECPFDFNFEGKYISQGDNLIWESTAKGFTCQLDAYGSPSDIGSANYTVEVDDDVDWINIQSSRTTANTGTLNWSITNIVVNDNNSNSIRTGSIYIKMSNHIIATIIIKQTNELKVNCESQNFEEGYMILRVQGTGINNCKLAIGAGAYTPDILITPKQFGRFAAHRVVNKNLYTSSSLNGIYTANSSYTFAVADKTDLYIKMPIVFGPLEILELTSDEYLLNTYYLPIEPMNVDDIDKSTIDVVGRIFKYGQDCNNWLDWIAVTITTNGKPFYLNFNWASDNYEFELKDSSPAKVECKEIASAKDSNLYLIDSEDTDYTLYVRRKVAVTSNDNAIVKYSLLTLSSDDSPSQLVGEGYIQVVGLQNKN